MVTASPDVATSTNLSGWILKAGVFGQTDLAPRPDEEQPHLSWQYGPHGQHIELGISEMNLFMMLGMFGLSAELCGQQLIPIGTVYDPFVCRGLDALIYGLYSGAKFIFAGTPSGRIAVARGRCTPIHGNALAGRRAAQPQHVRARFCPGVGLDYGRSAGGNAVARTDAPPICASRPSSSIRRCWCWRWPDRSQCVTRSGAGWRLSPGRLARRCREPHATAAGANCRQRRHDSRSGGCGRPAAKSRHTPRTC